MAAPVKRQRELPNLPHKHLLSSHNLYKTRPFPEVLPVCSPKPSIVFVKITFTSCWTLAVPKVSSCRTLSSACFCWSCNSPRTAWQLEGSSRAMPWHTCRSLAAQLCFCSSLLFSLLFFSLISSPQQFSSFKISFPCIFPPSSFVLFTYLVLFSCLRWQHQAEGTGL